MTFTELVRTIADRMNLKSDEQLARVGSEVNARYREVMSSIGISQVTEFTTATATTTIGSRSLTFGPTPVAVIKLLTVYSSTSPSSPLDELPMDVVRTGTIVSDPPSAYAVIASGARSVTIYLNSVPATAFVLTADVEGNVGTLSGTMTPAFDEDFHDILMHGVLADELEKKEAYDHAKRKEARFEKRLSELRLKLAVSARRELVQGGR